jgi:hypothetical protein
MLHVGRVPVASDIHAKASTLAREQACATPTGRPPDKLINRYSFAGLFMGAASFEPAASRV